MQKGADDLRVFRLRRSKILSSVPLQTVATKPATLDEKRPKERTQEEEAVQVSNGVWRRASSSIYVYIFTGLKKEECAKRRPVPSALEEVKQEVSNAYAGCG
jgi:hypothetical protein